MLALLEVVGILAYFLCVMRFVHSVMFCLGCLLFVDEALWSTFPDSFKTISIFVYDVITYSLDLESMQQKSEAGEI